MDAIENGCKQNGSLGQKWEIWDKNEEEEDIEDVTSWLQGDRVCDFCLDVLWVVETDEPHKPT